MKEFSEACERNKAPILDVLRVQFGACRLALEIGSGTGQHAVHFAAALPHLVWQPSDLVASHASIRAWIADAGVANVRDPLELDVLRKPWPIERAEGVFSANTAHIMGWAAVEAMLRGVGSILAARGRFCLYGPFRYQGRHTANSNALFDEMLRARDPQSGVRDFETVDAVATAVGLRLVEDIEMPANNRTLVWEKDGP